MPVWYEKNKSLEDEGKVRTIGLIQEQHPDRCQLFMQWKQMDFPVLVDSLNLLDVGVVPITVLIDEAGVVRAIGPSANALAEFVDARPAEAAASAVASSPRNVFDVANRHIMFGHADELDRAIELYQQQCTDFPDDDRAHFRLGVAYRKRFDHPQTRLSGDFANSVAHWEQALALNPRQYIWRRRIQQYGPRLDKPYPFYDWISEAQREIAARGEVPKALAVELSGAEIAAPLRGGAGDASDAARSEREPDPEDQIPRDKQSLFGVEPVVVHDTGNGNRAVRVHLLVTPSAAEQAKWNDEAGASEIWIVPPEGWSVDRRLLSLAPPSGGSDSAARSVEFEVKRSVSEPDSNSEQSETPPTIRAYLLYNVCFGPEGVCTYLRQDFEVALVPRR